MFSLSRAASRASRTLRPLVSAPKLARCQSAVAAAKPVSIVAKPNADDPTLNSDSYASDVWATNVLDPRGRADPTNRAYTYFVLGGGRFLYASLARVAVLKAIGLWTPAADVLAMASLEIDISAIAEGQVSTVLWRGKPVFIRHRTAKEVAAAEADDKSSELKDPQPDSARVQNKDWLVVMGICTHLGCVPVTGLGDYGGWFCPCHGSHYDTSGRIRKGPAPLNLEVPEYRFLSDKKILLG